MLTIVTWKWGPVFSADYVNRLAGMLRRHLCTPHRLVCITDDGAGIDPPTLVYPMPQDTFEGLNTVYQRDDRRWTPCFRRLNLLDAAYASQFGQRLLQIDLDVVIMKDITSLVTRPEPLVMYRHGTNTYSPTMMLLDTGYLQELWEMFHKHPEVAYTSALMGGGSRTSDMAIFNGFFKYKQQAPASWSDEDGVHSYWRLKKSNFVIPPHSRMVFFSGETNPHQVVDQFAWVSSHWRV